MTLKKIIDDLDLPHPVKDIAGKTGFLKGNISRYINGKVAPSDSFLREFCKAYNLDYKKVKREIENSEENYSKPVNEVVTPLQMEETDYRDRYIALLEKQLSMTENNENALKQSVSLLMNQVNEMRNEAKINYANVELMLQEVQFQLLHHQRFAQFVSTEALDMSLQDVMQASDKIKHEILEEAENSDS